MPTIVVTNHVMNLIRGKAEGVFRHFRQTGKQRPDGDWTLEIDDELLERLTAHQLLHETISDTIERAISKLGPLH